MVLSYTDWNNIIASYFFNEDKAGRDVVLFINQEIIDELGKRYGEGFPEFVRAVAKGPDYLDTDNDNVCVKAHQTFTWTKGITYTYPPYLAYLALFVCAATVEGDYDPHSYYPKLKDLVNDTTTTTTAFANCFGNHIEILWDDLESWSQSDKAELLGRFTKTRRGALRNVGMVYAQTVLSEGERRRLPVIFSRAGLDPTDPPTDEVLERKIIRYQ